jgi:Rrf2 family protein
MQANSNFTKSIHLCIYLNLKGRLVSSTEFADSLKTNPVVVRRLISLLKKHQIIGSIAGAHGGFFLERPADRITLWEIYLAVKEKEFFNRPKVNPNCVVSSNLAVLVHDAFTEAEISMKATLDQTNIAALTHDLESILAKKEAQKH